MRGNLGDIARLYHVFDAIEEIENYLKDADFEKFSNTSMLRFACIKQLEIIGEASTHISVELKLKCPEIQWNQIKGMRNIFVHEYFGIDAKIVWEILIFDLPEMKIEISKIINSLSTKDS